jgi:bifunctional non-homologous end joining protein LigD
MFDDPPITKVQVAEFYRDIAALVLPGLIGRPLMLLRCPDGSGGPCFFQKHMAHPPDAVREIVDREGAGRWIYVQDLNGLLGLVQMNAVEYHVWGCKVSNLERIDQIVMDLDPDPDVPWTAVRTAAVELRDLLSSYQLESFVRTSGGKGLHVVVPVRPAASWERGLATARFFAERMAQKNPQRYVSVAARSQRKGKIFIDYLRNARGSTAVCSYSLRNRPGVPVATPLSWDELSSVRAPDQIRFENVRRRLSRLTADPWAGFTALRQALPPLDA